MKFTEAQLESAIIELLGVEGCPHVLGEAIVRQPQEVLIKADLRAFLAKQYASDHITPQEIEAVIKQLEAYSAADLYESNKAIMKLVSDGFLLKREDRSQKDLYIQLIDYSDLVAFREPEPGEVTMIMADEAGIWLKKWIQNMESNRVLTKLRDTLLPKFIPGELRATA